MAEKYSIRPEFVNLIMHVVEALDENGDLDNLLDLLADKGYLDRKKDEAPPKTSIADETWEYCLKSDRFYCVGTVDKNMAIASKIAFLEHATAIAALPELVKATRTAARHCKDWPNPPPFVALMQQALEKAGEKL